MYFSLETLTVVLLLLLPTILSTGDSNSTRYLLQVEEDVVQIGTQDLIEQCDLVVRNNSVCTEESDQQAEIMVDQLGRVIGGWDADARRWPYLLSLQAVDEQKNNSHCRHHFCGATLIAPNLALTAAHCIWGEYADKRSSFDRQNLDKLTVTGTFAEDVFVTLAPQCRHLPGKETKKAISYFYPTFFSPRSLQGDLAVLQLDSSFVDARTVQFMSPNKVYFNSTESWFTTVGWGALSVWESEMQNTSSIESLQQGLLQYIDYDRCREILKKTNTDSSLVPGLMFCAQNDEVDACLGDSGGPLIAANENGEASGDPSLDVQVGIVSWGTTRSCSSQISKQDAGVYTNVLAFAEWIDKIVKVHQYKEIISQQLQQLAREQQTQTQSQSESEYQTPQQEWVVITESNQTKNSLPTRRSASQTESVELKQQTQQVNKEYDHLLMSPSRFNELLYTDDYDLLKVERPYYEGNNSNRNRQIGRFHIYGATLATVSLFCFLWVLWLE